MLDIRVKIINKNLTRPSMLLIEQLCMTTEPGHLSAYSTQAAGWKTKKNCNLITEVTLIWAGLANAEVAKQLTQEDL